MLPFCKVGKKPMMEDERAVPANLSTGELDVGKLRPEQQTTEKRKRSRRRVIMFVVVGLLNAGLLALLASQLLVPANQGSATSISPLIGHPAPDFTLPLLSADPVPPIHLASFRGKPVMINFWASWCVACQQEAPLLENTWQRVQHQGIVFLGIDYNDTQSDGLNFLHQYGITYPNVTDTNGQAAINYGLTGVPETVFIDRRGIIVQKVIGELTEQTLQENLNILLQKA